MMKIPEVHSEDSITAAGVRQRLEQNVPTEILDVRTPPEHAAVHLPGATLVPLGDLNPQAFLKRRIQPDAPLYLLCQSGGRARKAIEQFARAGFNRCVLIEGGMDACLQAGVPVRRGSSRVLPVMQQVQVIIGAAVFGGAVLALAADARFAIVPIVAGAGLIFAGTTGKCGLAVLLARMPWNHRGEEPPGACYAVGNKNS